MEAFINRWLWLMSLNDIRKLRETIQKQSILLSSVNASLTTNSSAAAASNANAASSSTQQSSHSNKTSSTSPSELPPPSPASSIGSSAGSVNGGTTNATHSTHQSSSDTIGSTPQPQTNQQQNQLDLMQKIFNLQDKLNRYNDYVIRSQTYWDSSEQLINEHDYLNGLCFSVKLLLF